MKILTIILFITLAILAPFSSFAAVQFHTEPELQTEFLKSSTIIQNSNTSIRASWVIQDEDCDSSFLYYWNIQTPETILSPFMTDNSGSNYGADINFLQEGATYGYFISCSQGKAFYKSQTNTFTLVVGKQIDLQLSNIRHHSVGAESVVIEWSADRPCLGRVHYWRSNHPDAEQIKSTALSKSHVLELRDLDREAMYNYRIACQLENFAETVNYPSDASSLSFQTVSIVQEIQANQDRTLLDRSFAEQHAGKIFLQVEEKGEAWYIHPETLERHYLGRPHNALQVMRDVGLGISNADIEKIAQSPSDADNPKIDRSGEMLERLRGKILLQVEENGEAWYVAPNNKYRYFLGRPTDALRTMELLGVGITNEDLAKFEIAS